MRGYSAFPFLKEIYYVRVAGTEGEEKAAKAIQEEIKKLGGEANIEEFEVDSTDVKNAKLFFNDGSVELECAGVGYSGCTPKEGITGEFFYATCKEAAEITNLKGKIIFSDTKRVPHFLYEKAIKDGAVGLIVSTGSVYKKDKDVDLDPYLNRELDYKLGKVPTVMVRKKAIEKVLERMPKNATIVLETEDLKKTSRNVVVEIKGSKYPDEIIVFTAHFDSVSYSKGAYDNGTGVISLLQIYEYFKRNVPARSMKFIFCGAEEMGLLGSKAYVEKHADEIKDKVIFNINIDMVAATLGRDIACVTGDNNIVNYLNYMYKEIGFPLHVYQGVYSSDSTHFADKGVPAVSFARLSGQGGAVIHSHDDVIERLSVENFNKTMDFVIKFADRMINSYSFPIEKAMPDNMKADIDKYFERKKENKEEKPNK